MSIEANALDKRVMIEMVGSLIREYAYTDLEEESVEIERMYVCEDVYASFFIATDPTEKVPCVRIEIGVLDDDGRHPTSGLKAEWDPAAKAVGKIQTIILDGVHCSVGMFVEYLQRILLASVVVDEL